MELVGRTLFSLALRPASRHHRLSLRHRRLQVFDPGGSVHAQSPAGARTITGYGAKGDGKTLNTKAINQAIRECSLAGGGTVIFPPGDYLSGSIELLKNVSLYLEAGAVIVGSTNLEDYVLEPAPGTGAPSRAGLVTARHANNVDIEGFSGRPAHKDGEKAAIALSKGSNISIRSSKAEKGTG